MNVSPDIFKNIYTILVVDDEAFMRESTSDFLKEYGFSTITSPDAIDALNIIK